MSELSYLEKLMDGVEVEWLPLSKVFNLRNGYTPSKTKKEFWANGDIPWFRMDDIRENGRILGNSLQKISSCAVKGGKLFPENSILISTSATIGEHALITVPHLANQRFTCLALKESYADCFDIKFLFYYCFSLAEWCRKNTTMSSFASVDMDGFKKFLIPRPCPDNPEKSLAIQSEIVRILDKFTALTAELTAELNMRKKQYNYYRDQLLSFDESSVEWKTLLEACDYVDYRGKTPKKTQSGIFLVTAKNIRMGYIDYHASQEFISEEDYAIVMRRGLPKKGDVLITTEAPCGFVAQVNRENIALAQRVIKYRSKNTQLSNSFLKHYLLGSQFQDKLMQAATGSTVKGIKGSRLHQLKIPIPSKVEQDRIVAILDKFDTLTNSITEGLPREIELRQKQYEYYRDLLFSFPKPETVSN
ncbi:restriction endonuclease subunit S [Escherichia coli]|uniref:Type I restriction-modification enzyme S subunit n=1 Tax=Escherichia coli TaxID=562 RepID=A0A0K3PXV8_ECOLX|nr:restriction endonuclease subunit S [Escherichia coli]EHX38142.1 type I restriction modification DNA specificity domain protein [Escherichia coli DEC12D]CTS60711.1 type I restriction-modification enzyme S subunit [Escherichia coli]CTS78038.1 type I restriction-modification enzyme S subunit [Escherichia coli]CTT43085.1 type I restriction-modification enzyme S subunit [Escherichia coli]CTT91474.1 type I restriction-modification enzyme S subunit [Escherichia coli]